VFAPKLGSIRVSRVVIPTCRGGRSRLKKELVSGLHKSVGGLHELDRVECSRNWPLPLSLKGKLTRDFSPLALINNLTQAGET
jgi:hypothetical protein